MKLPIQFEASYSNRGRLYYTLGKYKEALADLNKALSLDTSDVDAYKGRGQTYQALADRTKDKKQKADYRKKADADFAVMEKLGGSR